MRKEERIRELREELAQAMEHIEDEFSLRKIDEITAEMERLEPRAAEFDKEKAKAEFFENNLPAAEAEREKRQKEQDEKNLKAARRVKLSRRIRAAAVIAAVLLCLNGATIAIADMGFFEALFDWDDETFQITTSTNNESVYMKYDKAEITDSYGTTWEEFEDELGEEMPVPGYLIDNMELEYLNCLGGGDATIQFDDGEKDCLYSTYKLKQNTNGSFYVEKTDEDPIEFKWKGLRYYFVKNKRWITIVWQYRNQVYLLSGDFDETLCETVVKSLEYKEE